MTQAELRILHDGARDLGVEVDADTVARISLFLDTFALWNRGVRLTAEGEMELVVARHVVDSLAALPHLPCAGFVVDVGSGGGFPGIILACARPDLEIVLIESRRRKVSFLRAAIRATGLPHVRALEMRAEQAPGDPGLVGRAEAVISRGMRLETFVALAAPLLASSGEAIAMQTPRTSERASAAGMRVGLHLVRRRTYRLPRNGSRTLLFFGRRPVPSSLLLC